MKPEAQSLTTQSLTHEVAEFTCCDDRCGLALGDGCGDGCGVLLGCAIRVSSWPVQVVQQQGASTASGCKIKASYTVTEQRSYLRRRFNRPLEHLQPPTLHA